MHLVTRFSNCVRLVANCRGNIISLFYDDGVDFIWRNNNIVSNYGVSIFNMNNRVYFDCMNFWNNWGNWRLYGNFFLDVNLHRRKMRGCDFDIRVNNHWCGIHNAWGHMNN